MRLLEEKKGITVQNSNYFNCEKCLFVHIHTYDPFLAQFDNVIAEETQPAD